jgi:hypothetical protein
VRQPHGAEAAGAELFDQRVAAEHHRSGRRGITLGELHLGFAVSAPEAALLPGAAGREGVNSNLQEGRRIARKVILTRLLPAGDPFFVSFFDDDDPPTRAARPRRPARPATTGTRARPTAAAASDPQQLMIRRAVALGIGALILILLVLGIKGCVNSRTKNALRDYNRNVAAIVQDSNDQVSRRLFELLGSGQSTSPIDLQQNVNQVRVTADEDVKRARALDTPGDMKDAQFHLLEVLTLRAGAVQKTADLLPDLQGDNADDASNQIAGQMSAFLASDVIYSQRATPFIKEALDDHDIGGQTIASSQFLPDQSWLDSGFIRQQLTGKGGGRNPNAPPAPGTHGHGLTGTSVADVPLEPSPAVTRVPAGSTTQFDVKFQNQGENDEFDVPVRVVIRGSGKPISVQKRVDQTTAGQTAEATVPLGTAPPIGTPVRVEVTIVKVAGEVKTDNNTATYTVIFTR